LYVDGGIGCNNPVAQVLDEADLVFGTRKVTCVISIGTGTAETIAIPKFTLFHHILPLDVVKAMCSIATDCEHSAQEVAQRFQDMPNVYFRFNREQGMQTIGLGQWERLDGVAIHTDQYMRTPEVDRKLDGAVSTIRGRRTLPTAQIGMRAV
jgi:hypothetical protein